MATYTVFNNIRRLLRHDWMPIIMNHNYTVIKYDGDMTDIYAVCSTWEIIQMQHILLSIIRYFWFWQQIQTSEICLAWGWHCVTIVPIVPDALNRCCDGQLWECLSRHSAVLSVIAKETDYWYSLNIAPEFASWQEVYYIGTVKVVET